MTYVIILLLVAIVFYIAGFITGGHVDEAIMQTATAKDFPWVVKPHTDQCQGAGLFGTHTDET